MHATKAKLLDAGLPLLLKRGYSHLGVQDILDSAKVPKGSFYHHFAGKEDFVLQVIDQYMAGVHRQLDEVLADHSRPPLDRVREFFERTRVNYRDQGYLGCLLGTLGQELAATSDVFRRRLEGCLTTICARLAKGLAEAQRLGDLALDVNPKQLANVLVNCWEGAALRSRLVRNAKPLESVLDFYFSAVSAG